MNNNYIGLYPDKNKKAGEKQESNSVLTKLESALTTELEKKANVVTAPLSTQAPTPEQKQEQQKLVKEPMLYQRNKLGDYPSFQNLNDPATKAMAVQKLNDMSDLERIQKQNANLRHLSSQFGLSDLSNRSHKKYVKKGYNKLQSQTHV